MQAARIVAVRETYRDNRAICMTSGLRVTIRLTAWANPDAISLISSLLFLVRHRSHDNARKIYSV